MPRRRDSALLGVVLLATAWLLQGCASALPPLEADSDLGAPDPALADAAAAEQHLREAEAAFGQRPDVAAVREAVRLYRRAAMEAPASADGIVGATRALVWLAGSGPDAEREEHAGAAVRTAQWCEQREPERADCDYWLALAVGIQADARRSTAIDGVRRMAELLRSAIRSAPGVDHHGPYRVLARVLVNAPGWPTGPGDPDEGLRMAETAVAADPDHAPNQLVLAEALEAVDRPAPARLAYERALVLADAALAAGHPDAGDWRREAKRGLDRR